MSKHFAIGVLMAALCLVLVGCGGDGPNLRPELDRLTDLVEQQTGLVEQQTEKLDELETDLETEREQAADREETLQEQLDEAEQETADAEEELEAERQRREAAEQQAQLARQQAQEEIRRQARALEANQRAENLLNALEGLSDPTAALTGFTAPPEAEVSVATKNTLTFGPSTSRKSSSTRSGFRYAKVTDTFGRTRTTAIYTDRELSRKLLDHYGSVRNDDDMTVLNLDAAPLALPSPILQSSQTWSVSVPGLSTSLRGVDDDSNAGTPTVLPDGAEDARTRTSYSGNLHGQGGSFVCRGEGCQVQATPDYEDGGGDNGQHALLSVAVVATGTGSSLHFQPDSDAKIELYQGGPVGVDDEYMVFGYWIEDPESATGAYRVSPFAQVTQADANIRALPTSGEARYTGAAVGVYVESPPFGSTDTDKRQGDFEASVSLTAMFGTDTDDVVGGWISGFNTTPRGDSAAPRTSGWRVTLADVATTAAVTADATIDGLGGSGNWAAQFVQARANAPSAEPPPAIVGVFDTSGPSLHLVGAFGAER